MAKTITLSLGSKSISKAIKEVKAGRVEFKMDKTSNMSVVVGKRSFAADKMICCSARLFCCRFPACRVQW